jgi:hypothetical protein
VIHVVYTPVHVHADDRFAERRQRHLGAFLLGLKRILERKPLLEKSARMPDDQTD